MRTRGHRRLRHAAPALSIIGRSIREGPLAAAPGGQGRAPLTTDQRALACADEDRAGIHFEASWPPSFGGLDRSLFDDSRAPLMVTVAPIIPQMLGIWQVAWRW